MKKTPILQTKLCKIGVFNLKKHQDLPAVSLQIINALNER